MKPILTFCCACAGAAMRQRGGNARPASRVTVSLWFGMRSSQEIQSSRRRSRGVKVARLGCSVCMLYISGVEKALRRARTVLSARLALRVERRRVRRRIVGESGVGKSTLLNIIAGSRAARRRGGPIRRCGTLPGMDDDALALCCAGTSSGLRVPGFPRPAAPRLVSSRTWACLCFYVDGISSPRKQRQGKALLASSVWRPARTSMPQRTLGRRTPASRHRTRRWWASPKLVLGRRADRQPRPGKRAPGASAAARAGEGARAPQASS